MAAVIVGGAGSVAGSIHVNRRELARQQRVTLYRDVLPDVMALVRRHAARPAREDHHAAHTKKDLHSLISKVERPANLAGREDARRGRRMHELAVEIDSHDPYNGGSAQTRVAEAEGLLQLPLLLELDEELKSYQTYLVARLR